MRWLLNLKVEELDAQNKVRQAVEGELKMRNNNYAGRLVFPPSGCGEKLPGHCQVIFHLSPVPSQNGFEGCILSSQKSSLKLRASIP